MKKIAYGAAIATIVAFSAAPAFAEGTPLCDSNPGLQICQLFTYNGPNGVPLPVAALGLPIAAGLFAYAKRRQSR